MARSRAGKAFAVTAFDAYGTLFDHGSMAGLLDDRYPREGERLAATWRETQLRHTWLRTLMGAFEPFHRVTRDALIQTLRGAGHHVDGRWVDTLLDAYDQLPPFPEVAEALGRVPGAVAILSNGSQRMLDAVVGAAALERRFDAILSVDMVGRYKPDPAVYALVTQRFQCAPDEVRFVSANAWDCAGAAHVGFSVIHVQRSPGVLEELGAPPPAAVIADLSALAERGSDARPSAS